MRKWTVESFGEPEDVWRLEDNAMSFEPGPGQVKVKVEAAGPGLPETLMKNISLVGAMPVGYSAEQVMVAHQDLLHHWRQGELEVTNCQVFDFDDARSAIAHIAAGKVEGKVVVRLTGRSE